MQLGNVIFKEEIENTLNDNKAVQKYLLVTGDLQNSTEESLNYIVSDGGKLNKVSAARHLVDTKLPKNVVQKPNPLDFVFRDIAKFDEKIQLLAI